MQPDFKKFINEIHNKLVNGLSLGLASCLKRHPLAKTEIPDKFKELDLARVDFRFVLVINGHKESWLVPLQDALKKAMQATVKIWALQPGIAVVVLNEAGAREYGLIQ